MRNEFSTIDEPIALALATATSWMPRLGLEYVAWSVLLVALYLLLVRVLATETVRRRPWPSACARALQW